MTLQERKKTEALERLSQLEKLYGLNPKVRKYFAEGKLYYSYITGGVIGSIDTITSVSYTHLTLPTTERV